MGPNQTREAAAANENFDGKYCNPPEMHL